MAYDPLVNQPKLLIPAFTLGSQTLSVWIYLSTDASTVVDGLNYFTDALDLGMTRGDLVIVQDIDTTLTTCHAVIAVIAAGADLADGIAITSVTNTD